MMRSRTAEWSSWVTEVATGLQKEFAFFRERLPRQNADCHQRAIRIVTHF
jgi:hypothetical protein